MLCTHSLYDEKVNTSSIKLIAVALMVIDHIGLFLYPQELGFRLIGRLSFPLFAWLIANGMYYTRDSTRYAIRVFVLAVLSQIPYLLLFHLFNPAYDSLNAIITLWLGIVAIWVIQKLQHPYWYAPLVGLLAYAAVYVKSEYQAGGVLMVVAAYLAYRRPALLALLYGAITIGFFAYPQAQIYWATRSFENVNPIAFFSPIMVLSVPLIAAHTGVKGFGLGKWWYLAYPLHFLAMYLYVLYGRST